ncbi:hypothetical protein NHX12_026353 [Muraenolepis orangiensis]|uniref:Secreted protein n=1 Tax=Muraenolepis orangiensis TaxID=630683 RepID=A0A9Q0IQ66_9TELE|nr:hypothetical protein NHX12_026353 [Muraenolepis orangiensis]
MMLWCGSRAVLLGFISMFLTGLSAQPVEPTMKPPDIQPAVRGIQTPHYACLVPPLFLVHGLNWTNRTSGSGMR